jgi:hypothetical protein
MLAGSREREEGSRVKKYPSKEVPIPPHPVTYFLQLGPTAIYSSVD